MGERGVPGHVDGVAGAEVLNYPGNGVGKSILFGGESAGDDGEQKKGEYSGLRGHLSGGICG